MKKNKTPIFRIHNEFLTTRPRPHSRFLILILGTPYRFFCSFYTTAIAAMDSLKKQYPRNEIFLFAYEEIPIALLAYLE